MDVLQCVCVKEMAIRCARNNYISRLIYWLSSGGWRMCFTFTNIQNTIADRVSMDMIHLCAVKTPLLGARQ